MVKLHAEHGGFEDVVMEAESAGAPKPERRFEAVLYTLQRCSMTKNGSI